MTLKQILPFARDLLKQTIKPGDYVVDGTCGNGNDTALLAELVGPTGKVYAFDIQMQAIEMTKKKLTDQNLIKSVTLIHDSHAHIANYIHNPIQAAIFNLGYLPGGDKQITTTAETSVASIKQLLPLLATNGLLIIVIYHGHPAGKIEKTALEQFAKELPQKSYHVLKYDYINQKNNPPYILAIEKRSH